MKKYFLLVLFLLMVSSVIAQKANFAEHVKYIPASVYHKEEAISPVTALMKKILDTGYYWNNPIVQIDTTGSYLLDQVMPPDSGYWFGTNAYNFKGCAELYDVNSLISDTALQILGVISAWHGHIATGSSNTIRFVVWAQDPVSHTVGDTVYVKGLPGSEMYSLTWPVSQLQIGMYGQPDTVPVITMFSSPVQNIRSNFFVGFDMSYDFNHLNGDTLTLGATPIGNAKKVGAHYHDTIDGGTIYIPRNAFEVADGIWEDCYYNYGFTVNLGIVPIVEFDNALSIKGVTKNDLTFFGSYPNPAVNNANIKFSITNATDISIQLMDIKGRIIRTIRDKLPPGEHTLQVSTSDLVSGTYVYLIRTNNGGAFAGKLDVIK